MLVGKYKIMVIRSVIARPTRIKFVGDFIMFGWVRTIILSKLHGIPNRQVNALVQPCTWP